MARRFDASKVINLCKFKTSWHIHGSNRKFSDLKECRILGIETSCDDTGCAVVNQNGVILGQTLYSQQDIHIESGNILYYNLFQL